MVFTANCCNEILQAEKEEKTFNVCIFFYLLIHLFFLPLHVCFSKICSILKIALTLLRPSSICCEYLYSSGTKRSFNILRSLKNKKTISSSVPMHHKTPIVTLLPSITGIQFITYVQNSSTTQLKSFYKHHFCDMCYALKII